MALLLKIAVLFTLSTIIPLTKASCSSQSPFYSPPAYSRQSSEIWEAFGQIEASLSRLIHNNSNLNTSSYSIEVTSSQSTLWSTFHTATDRNLTRPGAETVDESSRYRIASITKVFTVLGILQQHAAGNLSLDDVVDKYIPALGSSAHNSGQSSIAWSKITLRSLASQLSGLPRDWAQSDLLLDLDDPTNFGLPPVPNPPTLPKCDAYNDYKPCTAQQLLENLQTRQPLFNPNQKSTYSNIAFELLGLVLANVTGLSYEEYIESSILDRLNMTQTSFNKSSDDVSVVPKNNAWYFDVDEGVQNPTGGLYCSSSDMSMFLRHILTHYNDVASTNLNWLSPASFTSGMNSFYGMPWEIFRTTKILQAAGSRTPVTFFTKGGGLPGYRTHILLVPEYDLGITIFTAGDESFIDDLVEMVTVPLIRAADRLAARLVGGTYTGTYTAAPGSMNSTLTLSYSSTHGLEVTKWISNSTDMLRVIPSKFGIPADRKFHAQLFPTSLYRNPERKTGELWRIAVSLEKESSTKSRHSFRQESTTPSPTLYGQNSPTTGFADSTVWDDFCITDVDTMMYAGKPLNEVVFWDKDEKSGRYGQVELTAFRINMTRHDGKDSILDQDVLVQELWH